MNVISLSEAREKGLKTYFSGVPCKHGHTAQRRVSNRSCTECNKKWAKEMSPQRRKNHKLKSLYGISLEEYNKINESQNNVCAICKSPCNIKKILSVDHDHNTSFVRGLLCHNCNTGLGNFKDSEQLLAAAIKYLNNNKSFS